MIEILCDDSSCKEVCDNNSRIPKGIRMEQALTQLDVKILFDDFTYHANICNAH